MRRVALKSIAFRRTRALLTAMAIVLGVSMISGTYVLTDTIHSAFTDIFTASYKDTSAVISGREIVKDSASGTASVPASLLGRARRLPDVQAAAGAVMSEKGLKLLDARNKPLGGKNAETIGIGVDTSQPRFNPLKLVDGRWAGGPGEVVLDKATANKQHVGVGDTVGVAGTGAPARYRVTGIARYGNVDSLGGAMIGVFTVPVAQHLTGKDGRLDTISLAARKGVSPERLVRKVEPILPRSAQVKRAADQAQHDAKDVDEFLKFFQYFLLAFAAIALFVGSFVIFNTLSITVAQRAREFATLRTMGASRRQIMRSVLLEGAIVGVLASAAGLALGLGLAKGLTAVMRALALELPQAATVFAPRTAIVSMGVGVGITVLATIVPALRATRVPPIAAVREGATVPPSRFGASASGLAVATIVVAVAALALGSFGSGLSTGATLLALGGGVLALFVGVAMVAPALVRPMAAVLGAPARRLGGSAGALARGNATRNPARTASTAAALMIGLALVTVVATLGAGLRHSVRASLEDQVRADYVVTSSTALPAAAANAGAVPTQAPGLGVASIVLGDRARVLGSDTGVDGIDAAAIARTYDFRWARGSSTAGLARLGDDGAIVKKSFADKHHVKVGSALTMTGPSGRRLAVRVRGIYAPPAFDRIQPVLAPVLVSRRAFVATFPRPNVRYAFVKLDGAPGPAAIAALRQAMRRFPGTKVQTKAAWVSQQAAGINTMLNLLYVLLALSIVVSLFGMVNTLILAVFERTRELGMLRAIGMTRRQVRRMVRHESTITALIGAGLGLPVGLFLAGIVTRALSDQGLAFAVPVASLAVFVVAAIVAGLVAAVAPARRASRLDVLHALQYE